MRAFSILALTAALMAPAAPVFAQAALPGAPPAFTLTAAQLAAMLAQCRAGTCAAAVQAIIAQAREAGLVGVELKAIIATLASTLVEAARNEPGLAEQVAQAIDAAAAETTGTLAAALEEIAALVSAGEADTVDLTAVAQAATEEDAPDNTPDGGDAGSPA